MAPGTRLHKLLCIIQIIFIQVINELRIDVLAVQNIGFNICSLFLRTSGIRI